MLNNYQISCQTCQISCYRETLFTSPIGILMSNVLNNNHLNYYLNTHKYVYFKFCEFSFVISTQMIHFKISQYIVFINR